MIRIQDHLNIDNPEAYIDSKALSLWDALNPTLKGKSKKVYFKKSLIEKCKKYQKLTKSPDYLSKYANNNLIVGIRHKAFFDYLLASKAANLKQLIISRPSQFSSIQTNIFRILHPNDLYTGTPGNYSQTAFGSLLSDKIFNYTAFRASDFCIKLFTEIGFQSTTCPYCNDNKLNIIELQIDSKAYLELDHFYSKSQNPFFAVSFFNLIPSCHDCNSSDKGDKPFSIETHIHPYHEAFDEAYLFKISLKALLGDRIDNIDIENISTKTLDKTLVDLNLQARYRNNFEAATKLVNLFFKYKKYFKTEFEAAFKELLLKDIPIEKKNILKYQRGKMNRDLLKQIDIDNALNLLE